MHAVPKRLCAGVRILCPSVRGETSCGGPDARRRGPEPRTECTVEGGLRAVADAPRSFGNRATPGFEQASGLLDAPLRQVAHGRDAEPLPEALGQQCARETCDLCQRAYGPGPLRRRVECLERAPELWIRDHGERTAGACLSGGTQYLDQQDLGETPEHLPMTAPPQPYLGLEMPDDVPDPRVARGLAGRDVQELGQVRENGMEGALAEGEVTAHENGHGPRAALPDSLGIIEATFFELAIERPRGCPGRIGDHVRRAVRHQHKIPRPAREARLTRKPDHTMPRYDDVKPNDVGSFRNRDRERGTQLGPEVELR
jgi:hypothetical protein